MTEYVERDDGGLASEMSLRDHFAGLALTGILAEPVSDDQESYSAYIYRAKGGKRPDDEPGDWMARVAYCLADAMLRARGPLPDPVKPVKKTDATLAHQIVIDLYNTLQHAIIWHDQLNKIDIASANIVLERARKLL